MSVTAAIVGIAVIALVYFFIRQKEQATDKHPIASRPTKKKSATTFHAVSIKYEPTACSAAKRPNRTSLAGAMGHSLWSPGGPSSAAFTSRA